MTGFGIFGVLFLICAASSTGTLTNSNEVSSGNLQKLAIANNELAFNLLRRLTSESSENVFFSPFSMSTIFGLLFNATRGETAKELRKALGYEKADLANEIVSESFSSYLSEVFKNNSSDGYVLNAANAVLVDKKAGFLEEFRRNAQELYKTSVREADFEKESSRIMTEINDWTKEKTNGKIEKLLDELDPATIFVLLNAIYYKGTWQTPFKSERTRDEIFFNDGIEDRSVQMMHVLSDFPIARFDNFKALELPYEGGNTSMLILLPNQRNGLQDIEENLTPEKLDEVQRRLFKAKVDLSLPKFKLQFQKELTEEIQFLGADQIFRAGGDFSGMTDSTNVKVSQIIHKAVIEVNEEGSEATAVTGIGIIPISLPPIFKVNHSFLFAILQKMRGRTMILFLGSVKRL